MEKVLEYAKKVRMRVRAFLLGMKRLLKWYVIWFVLYALIYSLLLSLLVNNYAMIKEGPYLAVFFMLFLMVAVLLVFISNMAGLGLALHALYDALIDIKMWLYHEDRWLMDHSHGIGSEGFSFERFIEHDFLGILMALVLISHLLLSVKRCKENGVSAWLALIPIYNPLGLFYRKKECVFKIHKTKNMTEYE